MPTLTVYIAPPAGVDWHSPGHIWYSISEGPTSGTEYFGFAPRTSAEPIGAGEIYNNDNVTYEGHISFQKTVTISQEQYEILLDFGENAFKEGFDSEYNGLTNNCIDFVWAALGKIGITNPDNSVSSLYGISSIVPGANIQWLPIGNQIPITDALSAFEKQYHQSSGLTDDHFTVAQATAFVRSYFGLAADSEFLTEGQTDVQLIGGDLGQNNILAAQFPDLPTVFLGGPATDTIYGTTRGDDLIDGDYGNNTIYAGGGNDLIFGGNSIANNILIGDTDPSYSGIDILVAGSGNAAAADALVPGPSLPLPPQTGKDTLVAGAGDQILVGGGQTTTFDINAGLNINDIDIVWDNGAQGTIDIEGTADIAIVNDPNVTLQSLLALGQSGIEALAERLAPPLVAQSNQPVQTSNLGLRAPLVIIVNPSTNDQLYLGSGLCEGATVETQTFNYSTGTYFLTAPPDEGGASTQVWGHTGTESGTISGLQSNDGNDYALSTTTTQYGSENIVGISALDGGDNILGFVNGDFGINFSGNGPTVSQTSTNTSYQETDGFGPGNLDPNNEIGSVLEATTVSGTLVYQPVVDPQFYANTTTPTIDIAQFDSSPGSSNGGSGGGSQQETDVPVVTMDDVSDVLDTTTLADASGADDTLIGGSGNDTLSTTGSSDTILAGTGADTLISTGYDNTLAGGGGTDSLDYGDSALIPAFPRCGIGA